MKYTLALIVCLFIFSCATSTEDSGRNQAAEQDSHERVKHTEIYDNGQIKMDGWLEGEKRVGTWVSYYENGVRWSENEYRDGMKDGKSVSYYPNGIMRYRGHYIEDKEAGTWQFYDDTGKLVKEKDYNK